MLIQGGCKVQSHAAFTDVGSLRRCPSAVLQRSPLVSCTNKDPPCPAANTGNTTSRVQGQANCSEKACCEHQVRQAASKGLSPNRRTACLLVSRVTDSNLCCACSSSTAAPLALANPPNPLLVGLVEALFAFPPFFDSATKKVSE